MASKDDALAKKSKTIRDFFNKPELKAEFQQALPKHVETAAFVRTAITSIIGNQALLDCDMGSLVKALMQAAQLGLMPDGVTGHAYLIPYKNSKKGITEAQFQIGYKGLLSLVRRTGEIKSFIAQVVCENDKFDFAFGIKERLEHVPVQGDRGAMKCAYAYAQFKDGGYTFDVMFREDIEKVKKSSKASSFKDSPWQTWEAEMWRKTVAKRLIKYLPISVDLQRAAGIDEHNDMGLGEPVDITPSPKEVEDRFNGKGEDKKDKGEGPGGCTMSPKTCGKSIGPDEGDRYGCELNQKTCPY